LDGHEKHPESVAASRHPHEQRAGHEARPGDAPHEVDRQRSREDAEGERQRIVDHSPIERRAPDPVPNVGPDLVKRSAREEKRDGGPGETPEQVVDGDAAQPPGPDDENRVRRDEARSVRRQRVEQRGQEVGFDRIEVDEGIAALP